MLIKMVRSNFIKFVSRFAVEDWQERRIMLPSVVIAQAILESGAGSSELAVNANALFGIKASKGWFGNTYVKSAVEENPDGSLTVIDKTEWRAYSSWFESIIDHNSYIATRELSDGSLRYEKIIGNTNYKEVCKLLRECGYATASNYSKVLINIIKRDNLTEFDTLGSGSNG